MGNRLYVGNLAFTITEPDLQDLFGQAGTVSEVALMVDKFTGKSRGFAFVTMASEQDAQNAINTLHGKSVDGRALTVNEARPREERPPGGGFSGGGGRRDFGGGGDAAISGAEEGAAIPVAEAAGATSIVAVDAAAVGAAIAAGTTKRTRALSQNRPKKAFFFGGGGVAATAVCVSCVRGLDSSLSERNGGVPWTWTGVPTCAIS